MGEIPQSAATRDLFLQNARARARKIGFTASAGNAGMRLAHPFQIADDTMEFIEPVIATLEALLAGCEALDREQSILPQQMRDARIALGIERPVSDSIPQEDTTVSE